MSSAALYHALEIGIIKLDKELELYLGSTIRLLSGVPLVLTFGVFLIWILRALNGGPHLDSSASYGSSFS